jgi:uncharacterized membrane protein YeaQ/YmgE (transglycosylase-associated protein family)
MSFAQVLNDPSVQKLLPLLVAAIAGWAGNQLPAIQSGLIGGLIFGLIGGLKTDIATDRAKPNQRIWNSLNNM